MAQASRRWAAEILHFWFHQCRPRDWWGGSEQLDAEMAERFQPELEALRTLPPANFVTEPHGTLAAVLLFDQVPRNIYRGTPRAFAFDPLACSITHAALDAGFDEALPRRWAQFLAMPLMHSEHIVDHRRALEVFRRVNGGRNLGFARRHHRMIARFGRYPHRNKILGRETTPAEKRAIAAGFSW